MAQKTVILLLLALVFTDYHGPQGRGTPCSQKGDSEAHITLQPFSPGHCSESTCTKHFYAKTMKIQGVQPSSKFLISYVP